ncbi:hypothetical protein ACFYMI_36850 [Streptomyces collinus]|uniref:hypothetical protein n=1 Tax=Streptomyces collinus TaxID=42684 RepID=UPI003699127C
MADSARARLSEAMELFGEDGKLIVFKDTADPLGTTAEGADLAPHSGIERSPLRTKVAEANARSRGELL